MCELEESVPVKVVNELLLHRRSPTRVLLVTGLAPNFAPALKVAKPRVEPAPAYANLTNLLMPLALTFRVPLLVLALPLRWKKSDAEVDPGRIPEPQLPTEPGLKPTVVFTGLLIIVASALSAVSAIAPAPNAERDANFLTVLRFSFI